MEVKMGETPQREEMSFTWEDDFKEWATEKGYAPATIRRLIVAIHSKPRVDYDRMTARTRTKYIWAWRRVLEYAREKGIEIQVPENVSRILEREHVLPDI